MANIYLPTVKAVLEGWFQTKGTTRFDNDVLHAVNFASREINRKADLATRIALSSSMDGSLALSDEYLDILCRLAAIALADMGQRPAKGAALNIERWRRMRDDLCDEVRQDILNQAVAADSDDETDFVGLGARGG